MEQCKADGNACMALGDYVNAMKWYSQALTHAPREASLYSNRSFAFLRLGLTARALADADEAVKRRPEWSKAHFRRAEALSQAGCHAEALGSYSRGAALDPTDEHLQAQCVAAGRTKRGPSCRARMGGACSCGDVLAAGLRCQRPNSVT